jgi:hypothetical protein
MGPSNPRPSARIGQVIPFSFITRSTRLTLVSMLMPTIATSFA